MESGAIDSMRFYREIGQRVSCLRQVRVLPISIVPRGQRVGRSRRPPAEVLREADSEEIFPWRVMLCRRSSRRSDEWCFAMSSIRLSRAVKDPNVIRAVLEVANGGAWSWDRLFVPSQTLIRAPNDTVSTVPRL